MPKEKQPEDSARQDRKQRRQTELHDLGDTTWDDISEGSGIPIKVWKKAVSLVFWDDDSFNLAREPEPDEVEVTTYFAQSMMEAIWLNLTANVLL
jgi:hypothetical protein